MKISRVFCPLRAVLFTFITVITFCLASSALGVEADSEVPDHTYSIIALDRSTGQLGVAVQTHSLAVGNRVPWARPGVGAVATQASTNPIYGSGGLDKMAAGMSAQQSLAALLAADAAPQRRQVAMVDANGSVAVHTGEQAIAETCELAGEGFSTQANLMEKGSVCVAMARAFETTEGDLAARLMAALKAAQEEGGDIRGMQSAALLVVEGTAGTPMWEGALFNLRVDDHPQPLDKLTDLVRMQRARRMSSAANQLLKAGRASEALPVFKKAEQMVPDSHETLFWHGVSLAAAGHEEAAAERFKRAFSAWPKWREVIFRLPAAGLLPDDGVLLARIKRY